MAGSGAGAGAGDGADVGAAGMEFDAAIFICCCCCCCCGAALLRILDSLAIALRIGGPAPRGGAWPNDAAIIGGGADWRASAMLRIAIIGAAPAISMLLKY